MDILLAESICELINANNEILLKKALSQIEGSLSSWLIFFEKKIMHILAYTQASFEFVEEEGVEFKDVILKGIDECLSEVNKLIVQFNVQEQIRQGIRVTLVGSVNAGKSSLFNALIGKNRAIVTSIAGTTRYCRFATNR